MQNSFDQHIDRISAIDAEIQNLKSEKGRLESEIMAGISGQISSQLSDKDYGCGTANIDLGSYKIKAVVSKKVTWDQSRLAALAERIRASGENPLEYMKLEYDVPESKFKAWPSNIQSEFVAARTVTPSAPKLTFQKGE